MGWHETMQDLEQKLEGTLQGTYRPLDGVPFFHVLYPPHEEREAIRQFGELVERIRTKGWTAEAVSLTEILRNAVAQLLGCSLLELTTRLAQWEQGGERRELREQLAQHLPDEVARMLKERLYSMSGGCVVVLLRMGALYPFMRSSALESRLVGEVPYALVFPYPAMMLGTLLDAPPVDHHGRFYRGEVITWR